MKISKADALTWFNFFAELPEDEEILTHQQELVYATFAQIEAKVNHTNHVLMSGIKNLKTLQNRTYFVGDERKFPRGCRSCLLGTGLSAVRKTNKCNLNCKFCYDYGVIDSIPPIDPGPAGGGWVGGAPFLRGETAADCPAYL